MIRLYYLFFKIKISDKNNYVCFLNLIPLIKSFLWFCDVREDFKRDGSITISSDFLNSTQILPLCNFIKENNINKESIDIINPNVKSYFNNILYRDIDKRSSYSYIPFTKLPNDSQKFDMVSTEVYGIIEQSFQNPDPLSYIFGELSDNIYEHSEFENAYILAQKYESNKFLDLSLFDDGITIPGSFAKHAVEFKEDVDSINRAITGTSTKAERGRGKGLMTSYKVCKNQFDGEILIISGKGILELTKQKKKYNPKDNKYHLDGTLISIRCRYQEPVGDFYKLIN